MFTLCPEKRNLEPLLGQPRLVRIQPGAEKGANGLSLARAESPWPCRASSLGNSELVELPNVEIAQED